MKKLFQQLGYFIYMAFFGLIMAFLWTALLAIRIVVYVGSLPFTLIRGKLPLWSEKSFAQEAKAVDTAS